MLLKYVLATYYFVVPTKLTTYVYVKYIKHCYTYVCLYACSSALTCLYCLNNFFFIYLQLFLTLFI